MASLLEQVLDDMEDEYNLTEYQRELIEHLVQQKTQDEISYHIGFGKRAISSRVQYIAERKLGLGNGRASIMAEVIKRMNEKVEVLINGMEVKV